jgi:hypothetical protein
MGRFVCAALVAAVCASAASANMGPPWIGGRVVAEPDGMKGVRVLHETLVIDLKPVARGEFAHVEATYRFRNDGPARQLELLFATGANEIAGFAVVLDGTPVPSAPRDVGELPPSWQPPKTTPGFNGYEINYGPKLGGSDLKTVGFTLAVSPGEHTVRVSYRAPTSKYMRTYPVAYQQFAYVLAPAKSWDGFGKLEVTVHVPEGWAAASEPALTRDGDTLSGTFDGIPADALALTIQAPVGNGFYITRVVLWCLFAAMCVTLARWAWRTSVRTGRTCNGRGILGRGLLVAVVAYLIAITGFVVAMGGAEQVVPESQRGGSSELWIAIVISVYLSVLGVPAFALFTVVTGLVVSYHQRPVPPAN